MIDKKREDTKIKQSCGTCGHFCWVRQYCDKKDINISIVGYDYQIKNSITTIFNEGEDCDDYIKHTPSKIIYPNI